MASFEGKPGFELICEWDLSTIVRDAGIRSVPKVTCLHLFKSTKPVLFCLVAGRIVFRAALSSSMNQFNPFEDCCHRSNFTWHCLPEIICYLKAIDGSWLWIGKDDGSVIVFDWGKKSKFGSYQIEYNRDSLWKG